MALVDAPARTTPDAPYAQVLAVLARHVSRLNAEGVLHNALRRRGLTPVGLKSTDVPALLADLQHGLTLFGNVDPKRLRTELLSVGTASTPEARRVPITGEQDVLLARQAAVALCEEFGARSFVIQRVATVVAELARNIALYTPRGSIEVGPKGPASARTVRIVAADRGTGIPNLDEIMAGGYRSKTGMGLGLLGTKRLSKTFAIETGARGTTIEVELSV